MYDYKINCLSKVKRVKKINTLLLTFCSLSEMSRRQTVLQFLIILVQFQNSDPDYMQPTGRRIINIWNRKRFS